MIEFIRIVFLEYEACHRVGISNIRLHQLNDFLMTNRIFDVFSSCRCFRNLRDKDVFSKSDPMCVLFMQEFAGQNFTEVNIVFTLIYRFHDRIYCFLFAGWPFRSCQRLSEPRIRKEICDKLFLRAITALEVCNVSSRTH